MSENYWGDRAAKAQAALSNKTIAQTEAQIKKYYRKSFDKTLGEFEKVYNKIFQDIAKGKTPTPADLYKLDDYWKLQYVLKEELQALGDRQVAVLSRNFVKHFESIYESLALPGELAFQKLDRSAVQQMVNQIWCADGKSWSSRVWTNTSKLADVLNDHLIHSVATGAKPGELKKLLQREFDVAYHRADALVRTEIAHIQTEAARERYRGYGIREVEVLVDEDERTCPICAKLEGERYSINATMPVPAHTRCRCCIVPVVE